MATEPRWLSPEERETWLSISELVTTLPGALDTRLQQHAGITFYEYMVMAMLSEQTDRTLQLSELAELTSIASRNASFDKRHNTDGSVVRTVAVRGMPRSRPISPK